MLCIITFPSFTLTLVLIVPNSELTVPDVPLEARRPAPVTVAAPMRSIAIFLASGLVSLLRTADGNTQYSTYLPSWSNCSPQAPWHVYLPQSIRTHKYSN